MLFLKNEVIEEPPSVSPQPAIAEEDESILGDGNFSYKCFSY